MNIEETEGIKIVLDEYLSITRKELIARATEYTSEGENLDVTHIARAIESHARNEFQEKRTLKDYFPPVALLSALLAFVFAALGLWAILGAEGENAVKLGSQGFLDIAKIFAGAIVGSATAASVAGRKKS